MSTGKTLFDFFTEISKFLENVSPLYIVAAVIVIVFLFTYLFKR